jgi:hypothetical protein
MKRFSTPLVFAASAVLLAAGCETEVHKAHRGLADTDPNVRIKAIETILGLALEGDQYTGWQEIEKKGCRDPEPRVRVAAIEALGKFVEARPKEVVRKPPVGFPTFIYVDTEHLKSLCADPSAAVRVAAAKFWIKADVLSEHGINALGEMAEREQDGEVLAVSREALAMRLERSLKKETVSAEEAERLRAAHNLRALHR